MPGVAQPVYNPPQIFRPTSYGPDGLPNLGLADLGQNFLPDPSLMDESIEAKRRRIARVCLYVSFLFLEGREGGEAGLEWLRVREYWLTFCAHRLAICVGRRRLSVMESYRNVRIAPTIIHNVYSHRWRRREVLQKGMISQCL